MKRALLAFIVLPFAANATQYGRNYQQMMSLQATANAVNAANGVGVVPDKLPVPVLNSNLEQDIRDGIGSTSIADLERCSSIYRNGSFAWGTPDAGVIIDKNVCLAEIQMMVVGAPGQNPNVQNDKVVAVAHIAAGSSIKCNIDAFPESGYLPAAETVTFPADEEPTIEDVETVMNREQKQNSGWKTAAAALVGGAAGFMVASENKGLVEKAVPVAIGAAAAGGLTYASTQTGKVAGDTILSAGTNAAAGAVVGNMGSGINGDGDAVLVVKDCVDEDMKGNKCLWGYVTSDSENAAGCYFNFKKKDVKCPEVTGGKMFITKYKVSNLILDNDSVSIKQEDLTPEKWQTLFEKGKNCFIPAEGGKFTLDDSGNCKNDDFWVFVKSGNIGGKTKLAMIQDFKGDKFFGAKKKDYDDFIQGKVFNVVGRNSDGTRNFEENNAVADFTMNNFTPLMLDSSDGEVIDFNNKARTTGTAIGAGAGAALGGLASYQGAKSEIEQRWLSELDNYEGKLKDVYCVTGGRYLGHYNETIIIPTMK